MIRKLAKWLGYTLVVLVVAAAVTILVISRVSNWGIVAIYSGSMEPAIHVGSVVAVSPTSPENIKVGDVIMFAPSADTKTRVTHRVVSVTEGENGLMFYTKGDANEDPDPSAVPATSVTGKARLTIPYLGYFADFVKSKLGFYTLMALPALLLVLMALREIVTYSPRKERRTKLMQQRQRLLRLSRAHAGR